MISRRDHGKADEEESSRPVRWEAESNGTRHGRDLAEQSAPTTCFAGCLRLRHRCEGKVEYRLSFLAIAAKVVFKHLNSDNFWRCNIPNLSPSRIGSTTVILVDLSANLLGGEDFVVDGYGCDDIGGCFA
ncbi:MULTISPECIES: hypothetical protein [unclassified Streptomyces]|uniref:hypothetical protein n=1 Tax=unclassified Streptomyces TaxID=2593676 RepID=UPI00382D2C25